MPSAGNDDLFGRLTEILLPKGGYVVTLYEAYFDESYQLGRVPVMCVAGYIMSSENAKTLDREWRAILREFDLPYFHMVDCAHGNGVFSRLTKQQQIDVETRCIDLIRRTAAYGIAVAVTSLRFLDPPEDMDEYTFCVFNAVAAMLGWLKQYVNDPDAKVAFFFENGHQNGHKASQLLSKARGKDGPSSASSIASVTFAGKEELAILQAADLLAWQCRKHISDRIKSSRPPRKDMISLTRGGHDLHFFVFEKDGATLLRCAPVLPNDLKAEQYFKAVFSIGDEADETVRQFHAESSVPLYVPPQREDG